MKSLFAFLLLTTAVLAHASTVYRYVGRVDSCGWPNSGVMSPCPGTLNATLTLRDDGTPDRVDFRWAGYHDEDPYYSLSILRHPLTDGWRESVLHDYEGYDVFIRQRYESPTGSGPPYNYTNIGYNGPDSWIAMSGDLTGEYISVNTSLGSTMSLDAYWIARGRLSRVSEPVPLVLAVPFLGVLLRLRSAKTARPSRRKLPSHPMP